MDNKNKKEGKNIERPKIEEEKNVDKYQESVGDIETGAAPADGGLPPQEKVEKKEEPSPEASIKKELSPEVPIEEKKAIEVEEPVKPTSAKPAVPADDLSAVASAKEDKASRGKKVEEIRKLGQKEQVEALHNLALEKGPDFAVDVAKELNDAFVLDEFHDKLDRLGLIKEGKLEEI